MLSTHGRSADDAERAVEASLMAEPQLQVKDLSTHFFTDDGVVQAVRNVSFDLYPGETLGIVGESGCGKSVTALSIMGLVQRPGKVVGGQILLKGQDLLTLTPDEMREIRGRDVAMIFQDPLSSLNPVLQVGFQIEEAMAAHHKFDKSTARSRTVELLTQVRIPAAASRVKDYPHQFSGGMRQRAMIAMGLANEPAMLIADEPTTALDVTVQAQILELLRDLNQELGTSVILITHNLGVVAGLCKRVLVMYAGEIVEEGPVEQIFENPQHPYTWSLLRSIPRIDALRHERLRSIEGLPPDLIQPPDGCKFHPRCPFRIEKCFRDEPALEQVAPDQKASCWVQMKRAYDEMGAATITDTRPGAASGVHPGRIVGDETEVKAAVVAGGDSSG
jgi:oligopeptide/dipeptide ABC transporter ATP-binding protein